jgi:hypothetical protein
VVQEHLALRAVTTVTATGALALPSVAVCLSATLSISGRFGGALLVQGRYGGTLLVADRLSGVLDIC